MIFLGMKKCELCFSFSHTQTYIDTNTRTHTHARTHAHTHMHAHSAFFIWLPMDHIHAFSSAKLSFCTKITALK